MASFQEFRNRVRQGLRDGLARVLYWTTPGSIFRDRRYFPLWQRKGFHALKLNFYSPLPDTRELNDTVFARRSALPGIPMNLDRQVTLLADLAQAYRSEYLRFPVEATGDPAQCFLKNGSLATADIAMLYSMIRRHKPRRVIEIGAGYSTLVTAQALRTNEKDGAPPCHFTSVEPYPRPPFEGGVPGLTDLQVQPVQAVPLEFFDTLGANDILFIDSSHVLKIGSDVQYEFLEILPRLKPGVLIHVHDIFWPEEYPREWILEHTRFWNEQYLLQAFLAFNDKFEILLAGNALRVLQPAAYQAAFGRDDFADQGSGSLWLRRVS